MVVLKGEERDMRGRGRGGGVREEAENWYSHGLGAPYRALVM